MNDILNIGRGSGFLSDLDHQFARFMARLSPGCPPELPLAAALVSRSVSRGGVCLDLAGTIDRPPEELDRKDLPPSADAWRAALEAAPVVGKPGDFRPLVLDGHGRLYLYRYWDYEQRLAADLLRRGASEPAGVDEGRLKEAVGRIFGPLPPGEVDWQRAAAAVAVLKNLCVISGGPGTGKTRTVIRALALLQDLSGGTLRIGLAAPTGKAAARLEEEARKAREAGAGADALPVGDGVKSSLPATASTIHRLLGYRPDSVTPRHNREQPLPLDVLVVDEASMVALPLMSRLVDALPATARLILLGDRDQLSSVEAGRVLGDICGGAAGFTPGFAAQVGAATGLELPAGDGTGRLADSIVVLTRNYRFAGTGLGELARLVNGGEAEEALALATAGGDPGLVWRELPPGVLREGAADRLAQGYRACLEKVGSGAEAAEALGLFKGTRVLAALRRGRRGVEEVNRLTEAALEGTGLLSPRGTHYRGRPVMVTVNDYVVRLFNGDVGMLLPDPAAGGELRAFFAGEEGGMRAVVPARLPEHETVWAMTVHKAQGSEFDRVVIILPERDSPVLSRELLYTALTRARKQVEIWGTKEVFREAVRRRTERSSGLRELLWGAGEPR